MNVCPLWKLNITTVTKSTKKNVNNNLLNHQLTEIKDSSNMQVTFGKYKKISESVSYEPYKR